MHGKCLPGMRSWNLLFGKATTGSDFRCTDKKEGLLEASFLNGRQVWPGEGTDVSESGFEAGRGNPLRNSLIDLWMCSTGTLKNKPVNPKPLTFVMYPYNTPTDIILL